MRINVSIWFGQNATEGIGQEPCIRYWCTYDKTCPAVEHIGSLVYGRSIHMERRGSSPVEIFANLYYNELHIK